MQNPEIWEGTFCKVPPWECAYLKLVNPAESVELIEEVGIYGPRLNLLFVNA